MIVYTLALYISLNPEPPCFVIPVFTRLGSNQTFAQDLTPSGRIRTFMHVNTNTFTSVGVLAEAFARRIGEEGILAFWVDRNSVICGTRLAVSRVLEDIDLGENSPFVDVEVATLIGDHERIRRSAKKAAPLLLSHSSNDTYLARVTKCVKLLETLADDESDPPLNEEESLEHYVSLLEKEIDNDKWFQVWREAWLNHRESSRLIDVARWRLSTTGLGDFEFDLLDYTRYMSTPQAASLAKWWLNNRPPDYPGWVYVWSRDVEPRRFSDQDILASLNKAFASRGRIWQQWPLFSAWRQAFEILPHRKEEVIAIAERNSNAPFYHEYFIERIVLPVYYDDKRNNWARRKLVAWFKHPLGSPSWIDTFLMYGEEILTPDDFLTAALRWLRKFGKGTNKWADLFGRVKGELPREESWSIRTLWLMRARKDMLSWPHVFESLVDDAGSEDVGELRRIAKLWNFKGRERRRNATIDEYAGS